MKEQKFKRIIFPKMIKRVERTSWRNFTKPPKLKFHSRPTETTMYEDNELVIKLDRRVLRQSPKFAAIHVLHELREGLTYQHLTPQEEKWPEALLVDTAHQKAYYLEHEDAARLGLKGYSPHKMREINPK